ncbi:hypothetical protein JTE88_01555 [Arcanobacterium phocisimile]|uniref:MinD-like ATPase involved in chromosome partitioning or flagellar assembly n=1 Tax=Arcanobacterium phocisimile TaxID=1302235 RepID=A0ABX7II02_9ACTO|nr:hypothetical protein [Arcanobacterium phocisimile]QRV02470.1 hypothetical protein JTE88_01555 [Arcanobacterium phocisimile]
MSVLLCLPTQIDSAVIEMLAESGETHLIARRCADLAEVLAGARARIATLAVISEDADFLDLTLISELRQYVGVAIVARPCAESGRSATSSTYSSRDLRAFGNVEILSPLPIEIVARIRAVQTIAEFSPHQLHNGNTSKENNEGSLVAVWGPEGSHGRSTLIRDCAVLMAQKDQVRVVDGDVRSPSLAQFFDVEESSGIIGVARMIDQGKKPDIDAIFSELSAEFCGVELLAGMNTGQRWREISRPVADRIWPVACADCALTMVDLAGGLDEHGERIDRWALSRSALERADIVIHVASATPIGLRRLIEHWDSSREQGFAHEAIVLTGVRSTALGVSPMFHARDVLHTVGITDIPIFGVREERGRLDRVLLSGTATTRAYPKSGYSRDLERVCAWIEDRMRLCASISP